MLSVAEPLDKEVSDTSDVGSQESLGCLHLAAEEGFDDGEMFPIYLGRHHRALGEQPPDFSGKMPLTARMWPYGLE
jgi:hypothetical protein